jgi:AbrB family looped-hinge helix DNA binding protein
MQTIKLSTRGRITIPKDLRDKLNLEKGTTVHWKVVGPGMIELTPEKRA